MKNNIEEKLEKYDKLNNIQYFSIIMLLSLFLIYLKGSVKEYIPFTGMYFDDIVTPFICGFLGIAFWFRVSKILVPILKNSKIIRYISKNTFHIMTHHMLGFFILNLIWYFLSVNFSFIEGFNVENFKADISYRYLPKGLYQFNALYLMFGILISILISFCTKKITNKIKYIFYNKISKNRRSFKSKKI